MNKKEAAQLWNVPEKSVKKICRHMNIDVKNIPEDLVPVYVPEMHIRKDPHRYYIYVLEVINYPHLVLEGVDTDIIESCVTQLCQTGLIVPKKGKSPASADYHDYVITADRERFYEWYSSKAKQSLNIL